MKRAEELKKLSREHHGSLVMAKRILSIAESGDDKELLNAIDTVRNYYDEELEEHFQHEEHTIFSVIFKEYKDHINIARPLLKEHGQIRLLIPRITPETAREDLKAFADMLKNHTRVEEREFFPLIETLFTDEQLKKITQFVPINS